MLTTERLIVRPPLAEDAAAIVDYLSRNRAHLEPTSPTRTAEFYTVEHWEAQTAMIAGEFERGDAARMILVESGVPGRVVGTVSLSHIQRGPMQGANLGYSLDAGVEGRGLMHEALTAVIGYAFGSSATGGLNLHRLFAGYMPTNERSARVLRRLGFEVIGYCRDYLRIAGEWQDHVLTSLVNGEWTDRP